MRTSTCLLPKVCLLSALSLALSMGAVQTTQAQDDGVVPASYSSGSFFNRQFGTALRFNYHTRGYGTQDGVVSLGGMKVFNLDGATVFLDGQGTLSDDFGGGYNLGVGYRQLTTTGMSIDPQRILGAGFWTDGQSTAADNFFHQLGFSLESLGESFDLRVNGHFPLERTETSDPVLTGTGTPMFLGNNLFGSTESYTIDTAHNVVDGEFAKRIRDLEAWAFIGGYQLGGGGVDATGYRIGVRGYAVPDLAVSLQVTDDDQYATNVMFGLTWFIGRTHKGNGPCGNILDRFREPVLRNDFIATTSRSVTRAAGDPLRDAATNEVIRLVHVDDMAAAGGDGTFENPLQLMSEVAGNSQDNDNILVHGGAVFVGADGMVALQDGQRVFGEGVDQDGNMIPHQIDTVEFGLIDLPETAPGAQSLARPTINAGGSDVFTLADNNTVNNFTINNAGTAVRATPDDGALDTLVSPTLQNLQINTPGTGLFLDQVSGTALVENTVEINGATTAAVDINGGADGMTIAASVINSTGRSLDIQGRTGGTISFTGTIDDDEAGANTSTGVLIRGNTDSTINLTAGSTTDIHVASGADAFRIDQGNQNTTVQADGMVDLTAAGAGNTGNGLVIDGNFDDTTINFVDLNATAVDGDTVSIDDGSAVTISSADNTRMIANTGAGYALFNTGGATGGDNNAVLTVNSNIANSGGGVAVEIRDRAENDVTIAGTVTVDDMVVPSAGVLIEDNEAGNIVFSNALMLSTLSEDAVVLNGNRNLAQTSTATISFGDLDIDTTDGDGFVATAGGTVVVTDVNATNSIDVTGNGVGLNLNDVTIDDAAGVEFSQVNVGNGAGVGINLQDLDGTGLVSVNGGNLTTTGVGATVNIDNADNATLSNLTITNTGGTPGVNVTGQQTGSTVTLTAFDVTTDNADAVTVASNTNGAITFNNLTATTDGSGDAVVLNNNNSATVTINGMTADANGSGEGFSATGSGTLAINGTTSVETNTGRAINITGQTIAAGGATIQTVDMANGNTTGINLQNVDGGTLAIGSGTNAGDGGTLATSVAGNVVTVDNVENLAINNVTASNADVAGTGLNVTNQAVGSTASFSGLTMQTDDGDAVTVAGNAGGTIAFTNLDATTADGNVVTVDNNGTATTTFNGMELESTGAGAGFTATGSGTIAATGTNNVMTVTGRGVDIASTDVDAAGASFSSVNVNGAANAVVLNNLTSAGQVTIGSAGSASTMSTTTDTITVLNAANVNINNVDVSSTGGVGLAATNSNANDFDLSVNDLTVTNATVAVATSHSGDGDFTMAVTNSNLDEEVTVNATGTGDVDFTFNGTLVNKSGDNVTAFDFDLGNDVTTASISIDNSDFRSGDAVAFDFDSASVGVKNVTFSLTDTDVTNSSASPAAEIDASGATVMNATLTGNLFTNAGAGDNLDFAANSNSTVVNLLMTGNSTSGGNDNVVLREALGGADFNIVNRGTLPTDDPGLIFDNPGVNTFDFDSAGNVITDFDDIPALP